MNKSTYKRLRLILGDQLNASHSWFKQKDEHTLYLIAELKQESEYVRHHIQKICAFFAAMDNFASALKQAGFSVLHLTLDETAQFKDLNALLTEIIAQYQIEVFEYQTPDEYRLNIQLAQFCKSVPVKSQVVDSEHFLLPFSEIQHEFVKNTPLKMEVFYRKMRKRFQILMENGKPAGGKWNYDAANRNKLKPADLKRIPSALCFSTSVDAILQRIKRHQLNWFGEINNPLIWPVNRKQAVELLDYFCEFALPNFGQFQDAMTQNSPDQWSLFHSRLSFALNAKILHPMQVIQQALKHYQKNPAIDLAQIEGFIRQILGWREYVRGIYWINMPDYAHKNKLDANRDLPPYFWHGKTKMNCLHQCLSQSLNTAYAHHIQRLMVIGNFCLIAGLDPAQVDEWYLGVYIDAIEWVELPNTRGMSQFADGGLIATKPYAASANYIHKMSDYCQNCHYDRTQKIGEKACPYNSLYWHFLHQHKHKFADNPRMSMIYHQFTKLSEQEQEAILQQAKRYLDQLDNL